MKYALLLFAALSLPSVARADLKIVTTTPDFADLARQIGSRQRAAATEGNGNGEIRS